MNACVRKSPSGDQSHVRHNVDQSIILAWWWRGIAVGGRRGGGGCCRGSLVGYPGGDGEKYVKYEDASRQRMHVKCQRKEG